MSAALFDLALRVSARDVGAAVPRLLHNPAPKREVTVAVSARRAGGAIRVQAIGPNGRAETGSGAAGLAAIARAAGCANGDLGGGRVRLSRAVRPFVPSRSSRLGSRTRRAATR